MKKQIQKILKEESLKVLEQGKKNVTEFYFLEKDEELKEITSNILQSTETKDNIKQLISNTNRRFFLFTYPSDDFKVKGYISFVPDCSENPLLIFLRGGNGLFGLKNPATDLSCHKNYTFLATTYRGGVSEGIDEFGGNEVNDVMNLVEYFPILQEKLKMQFEPKKKFLLGYSRGGMEMFLTLSRFPSLQTQVNKAASLSGLLDLKSCINDREDMKKMFVENFGLELGNENQWIAQRDPITHIANLRKDLPFLILQGTKDIRVSLNEGYRMVQALKNNGNPVTYLEFPDADHCLNNQPNRMEIISNWFER